MEIMINLFLLVTKKAFCIFIKQIHYFLFKLLNILKLNDILIIFRQIKKICNGKF